MGRCAPGRVASHTAPEQVLSPFPSFFTLLARLDFLPTHLSKSAGKFMFFFPGVVVLHTLCHGLTLNLL